MIGRGGVGEAGAPTDAHELVNGAKVFFFRVTLAAALFNRVAVRAESLRTNGKKIVAYAKLDNC